MAEEYTIRQLAELLEVSKPTVRKNVKELAIEFKREDETNRRYYSLDDAISIIKKIKPEFDISTLRGKSPNFAENRGNAENSAENFPENGGKSRKMVENRGNTENDSTEIELLRSMLDVIQKQLEEKDKQLAIKDKQIQDLSDRLAEALQLTKGQQYIAAADKTTELLEADSRREQEIEKEPVIPKEKSFWKRIFRK